MSESVTTYCIKLLLFGLSVVPFVSLLSSAIATGMGSKLKCVAT